jgi:hypothetical protein
VVGPLLRTAGPPRTAKILISGETVGVRLLFVAGCTALLSGCADVRVVDPGVSAPALESMNDALVGRNVTIELASGEKVAGRDARVGAESTTWLSRGGDAVPFSVPTSSVARISLTGRLRPALFGGILGLGGGLVVGAALGVSVLADTGWEVLGAIAYGVIGGTAGLVAGAALGAAIGEERVYIIGRERDPAAARRAVN